MLPTASKLQPNVTNEGDRANTIPVTPSATIQGRP